MSETTPAFERGVHNHTSSRNISLSVITGLALLGLLITAVWDFAGFTNNEQAFFLSHIHKGNYKLFTAVSALFGGKMFTLLAIVMGAGMVLQLQKEGTSAGVDAMDAFIRRQIWFIIIGLFVAFIIIWPNEILYHLGIVGIILFAFAKLSPKNLFIGALVCTLIYCGKNYWYYADDMKDYKAFLAVKTVEKKFKDDSIARAGKDSITRIKNKTADSLAKKNDTLTNKQANEKGKWEGLVKSLRYDSSRTAADIKSMRAGYSKIWFYLKGRIQNKESNWLYSIGIWDLGAAVFLGMALFASGFFNKRFAGSTYLLAGLLLAAIGLVLAWLRLHNTSLRIIDYAKYIDEHSLPYNQFEPFEKLILATSYASLIMWLLQLRFMQWLTDLLFAVGKMALTNYVLITFACACWFYGYGLGFYGMFAQWEMYVAAAQISLVIILISVLWLRFYQMGPLEWALKCLIYRQRFPNKKENA